MNVMKCSFLLLTLALSCVSTFDETLLARFKRASRVKRIIGGTEIDIEDWPWLVHLTGKVPSKFFWGIPRGYKYFYCGGAVINKRWIITAAHCFQHHGETNQVIKSNMLKGKYWHIKAGETERKHSLWDSLKSTFGGWFGKSSWEMYYEHADSIHVHPDYNPDPKKFFQNDIALVKLSKDLPLADTSRDISAVRLPVDGGTVWPHTGANCTMKGWGCTNKGGSVTNIAKAVILPVRESSVCNMFYGASIGDTRICAGPQYQSKGICPGDSGGPLVCMDDEGVWRMAGLASFTSGSRPGQVPGVFTRLSRFKAWINDVID